MRVIAPPSARNIATEVIGEKKAIAKMMNNATASSAMHHAMTG